jgi:glycosidase
VGDWRDRAVYQVLTDRFAGGTGECEPERREYCGGTWRGLEERLGYIQGMGFDAVRSSFPKSVTPSGALSMAGLICYHRSLGVI